jgi:Protein of unknown function (DUF3768)
LLAARWCHRRFYVAFGGATRPNPRQAPTFDQFSKDNDPHCEHGFGLIEDRDVSCIWKIDYYDDSDMELMSPDPADPSGMTRILTVMLAEEC